MAVGNATDLTATENVPFIHFDFCRSDRVQLEIAPHTCDRFLQF
jgi:hypothetical protein